MPTPPLLQQALALHQAGRTTDAIPLYLKLLNADPRNAPALNLLAIAQLQLGNAADALPFIQKAIAIDPNIPDYLNTLGRALQLTDDETGATEAWRKAIALNPTIAEPFLNLGNSLCQAGQYDQAVEMARRGLALDPNSVVGLNNLGNALRGQSKIDEAIVAYRRALLAAGGLETTDDQQLKPNLRGEESEAAKAGLKNVGPARVPPHLTGEFAAICFNLGECHFESSNFQDAIRCYRTALQADPKMLRAHARLAAALSQFQRFDEAMESWREAAAIAPDSALTHEALGLIHFGRQEARQAVECLRRALEINPNSGSALGSLVRALESMGKFDEAEQSRKKYQLRSSDAPRSDLSQPSQFDELSDEDKARFTRFTETLKRPNLTVEDRIQVHFGLARILDEAGSYDEAFTHMAESNSLAKRQRELAGEWYDHEHFRRSVDKTIDTFTPDYYAQRRDWGDPSQVPVFIVGMPRSGTTLVHQIAASHSQVHGAGELHLLQQVESEFGAEREFLSMARWDADKVKGAAQEHLKRLQALGPKAARIVDKMPDNVMRVGQIATLFPRSRVIFCRRDPRDTCLSCFFQRFAQGLYFSLDLRDCGRRHLEIDRLVAHWLSVRPVVMLEMQYETLVNDLEGQSRRLIEFLGLPWEPACLEFYRAETAVLTASIRQVRKPIYQKSAGRWKHYQRHLGPLFEALGPEYIKVQQ